MLSAYATSPAQRVVILGASNVIRGLPFVVETARAVWAQPLDMIIAAGHGRSYGSQSWVLFVRGLPGILECSLWPELAARPALPAAALLTDIGNDILYSHGARRIAGWIEECLERLRRITDNIIVTQLPLQGVETLDERKFVLVRSLLFPRCRLSLRKVVDEAHHVSEHVVALAQKYNAHLIQPHTAWYGFDPIHIRRRQESAAWREILSPWRREHAVDPVKLSVHKRLALLPARHEMRWLGPWEQRKKQPCVRLPDGTQLSLF